MARYKRVGNRNVYLGHGGYYSPPDVFKGPMLDKALSKCTRQERRLVEAQATVLSDNIRALGRVLSLEVLAALVREGYWPDSGQEA